MVKLCSVTLIFFTWTLCCTVAAFQGGPDPWNIKDNGLSENMKIDKNVPPDLRMLPKKKVETEGNLGHGEWFFRRILAIVLKGGQFKQNEDGSVDISLQMRINGEEWNILEGLLRSQTPLSEDMYRRSVGYIEQAIYQPSIADKIIMAWGDYVQIYLTEYKTEITWTLAASAVAFTLFWLWTHMSHKRLMGIVFLALYFYEAFISFKEAEQKELDTFLTAVNSCKWYNIWSSQCEVPKPNPTVFLKHMNPLKIAVRMFTTLISEPMIVLSDALKTTVLGMTDGLWPPFDTIVYGFLMITFNVLLMLFLISIICNFVFNIPINLGYLGISLGLKQRERNIFSESSNGHRSERSNNEQNRAEPIRNNLNEEDRISGTNLQTVLNICAKALNAPHGNGAANQDLINNGAKNQELTNSSSSDHNVGASTSQTNSDTNSDICVDIRKRKKDTTIDETGDAH